MPPTSFFIDAIASVPPATLLKYAAIGALTGAVVMPLLAYAAMKTNYRKLRDTYTATGIPQTARLYSVFAMFGAALFAIIVGSQPVLDAAGENEVYIRGALIPVIMIVVGIPFVRALKRLRAGG